MRKFNTKYWCAKCKKQHYTWSPIGKEHVPYREELLMRMP